MANWSQLALPTMAAPAARNLRTQVASNGGRYPSSTLDPAVVCNPSVQIVSYMHPNPIGAACMPLSCEMWSVLLPGDALGTFRDACMCCVIISLDVGEVRGWEVMVQHLYCDWHPCKWA